MIPQITIIIVGPVMSGKSIWAERILSLITEDNEDENHHAFISDEGKVISSTDPNKVFSTLNPQDIQIIVRPAKK